MKFSLSVAMNPLEQFTELARTAEECGFSSIVLPDSLFYSESVFGGVSVHAGRQQVLERRHAPGQTRSSRSRRWARSRARSVFTRR